MSSATKVPKEKINEAKELLANTALTQLEKGHDLNEFANIQVEFGYLYLRDDQYESLFKITTDMKTVYFAAQQGKLMRLQESFSEEMFQGTAQQMAATHGDWK